MATCSSNFVTGIFRPSEGSGNFVTGIFRPSEGSGNFVTGIFRPSEGSENFVTGIFRPSEGSENFVTGIFRPSEGGENFVTGIFRVAANRCLRRRLSPMAHEPLSRQLRASMLKPPTHTIPKVPTTLDTGDEKPPNQLPKKAVARALDSIYALRQ